MDFNTLLSNANTALGSGNFETALDYAQKAVAIDPKASEPYTTAGKACISLDRFKEAEGFFTTAVKLAKSKGNDYFFLGYAQILAEDTSNALRSFTKALENNCEDGIKGQIYSMIAMINLNQKNFEDALVNLSNAEKYSGTDYDILKHKAACYENLHRTKETVFTLNLMKMLYPTNYAPYGMAFNILVEHELYDEAVAELRRAEKYADLDISYYNDLLMFTLSITDYDKEKTADERWREALGIIDKALKKGRPNAGQVFELYLRAAQAYLSINEPRNALRILDEATNPKEAFNSGFSVILDEPAEQEMIVHENISKDEMEAEMLHKWESGELESITEHIEEGMAYGEAPESIRESYLTPMEELPDNGDPAERYTISGNYTLNEIQTDIMNTMYVECYESVGDYPSMRSKAMELQSSSNIGNQYSGIYYELKYNKLTESENWQKKYRDRINYWTKRAIENPADFLASSFRIRCYLDLGDITNAEELCKCLPTESKQQMSRLIESYKTGGDEH